MIAARSAPATPPAPFSAFGGQTPGRPAGTSDAARTRAHAFAALSSRLAARRAAGMGLRLWLVCAALALCASAFTYWQVRVPLDGIARHAGGAVAAGRLGLVLAAFVLAAGAIAASRQVTLAAAPPGPEWLALPVEPALVERHLAREARLPALPLVAPATAAWLAGWGLLPLGSLLAMPLAFALAFWLVTRAACALALRATAGAAGPARRLPAAWRALVSARRTVRVRKVAAARFRNESRWRAIARLDRAVSLRAGSPRARLALALLFLVLGVAAWFMGRDPLELRAQAFAGFSAGCAALGAWAAWRAAGDPPPAVRPLPTSLADHWLARVVPMALLLGGTLVVHAVMPPAIPLVARVGLALSWALPAMLVTLLGLHLGLSLPGRPNSAETLYYGWLGAGLVASLAIPLFGWAMLIAAFVHATRRMRDGWARSTVPGTD